jgi:hypothetical protein
MVLALVLARCLVLAHGTASNIPHVPVEYVPALTSWSTAISSDMSAQQCPVHNTCFLCSNHFLQPSDACALVASLGPNGRQLETILQRIPKHFAAMLSSISCVSVMVLVRQSNEAHIYLQDLLESPAYDPGISNVYQDARGWENHDHACEEVREAIPLSWPRRDHAGDLLLIPISH